MKHPLYYVLILCLFSCTACDNSNQPETISRVATHTAVTAEPDTSFLIIPGKCIGQVELNMVAEMLHQKLGKADSGDAAMGKALLFWVSRQANEPRHYVAVYTINNFNGQGTPPTVQQVQVTSPQFQTAGGIRTGMPLSEIRKQFSNLQPLAYYSNHENQQVYIYDDPAQGIAFEVTTADSLCTAITVHQKGEAITEMYLPIFPDRTLLQ